MNRILVFITTCILTFGVPLTAYASTLDDVIGMDTQTEETQPVSENVQPEETQPVQQPTQQPVQQTTQTTQQSNYTTDEYLESIKQATDLSGPSAGAERVNNGITKVASFIVQILAYFITAFLVVRVVLDLTYICIPFTRSFLANGYGGNAQAGGGGMGMQQPGMGMGGMGMNSGMGMGGMGMGMGMGGMRGGYGMNRMGMGGMGMGGMQGSAPGANPAMGRVQWISTAALNAVAAESVVGQDGKPVSPLGSYAKDMVVVLVITPILLTLAITGVLTDLGFLLGQLITNAVAGIGTMF